LSAGADPDASPPANHTHGVVSVFVWLIKVIFGEAEYDKKKVIFGEAEYDKKKVIFGEAEYDKKKVIFGEAEYDQPKVNEAVIMPRKIFDS
jgi:hypothetical protein